MAPPDTSARTISTRGLRRRQLLLESAGELLMAHGFGAVSHRAVAQHADLPLAATTYYFTSLDDLIEGAVRHLVDSWLAGAGVVIDNLPPVLDDPLALAEALVRVAALGPAGVDAADSPTLLSLYDRYVEAARHPRLRPVVAEYNARIEALLADVLRRRAGSESSTSDEVWRTAGLVLAVIDGSLLRVLAEGLSTAVVTAAVEDLLRALHGGGSRR